MNNIEYFPISEQGLRDNNEDFCLVESISGGLDVLAIIARSEDHTSENQ